MLGLNSSRYGDMTAHMSDEDWKLANENLRVDQEKRRRHLEVKELENSKIDVIF